MDSYFRPRRNGELSRGHGAITLRHFGEFLLAALAYAVLAVVLLHPWFSDPTRFIAALKSGGAGVEAADVNLVMWILSWDWHALTTNPLGLFDANIFYPAKNTLAASEHLLGHVAIYGPVYGVSGNPVLAYQVNFLGNLALSGAGLYALLRHWGLSTGAAFFGGFLYVFFPFRIHFANYPHLSAGQYAPLAMLFLDRALLYARIRDAALFALCLLMQMLCSYYLAYFTVVALAGYLAGVVVGGLRSVRLRGVVFAGLAAVVAGAVFAAFSIPYLQLRSEGAIPNETDLRLLKLFSVGPWWEFLARSNLHYLGMAPLLFAGIGLLLPRRVSERVPWVRPASLGVALACYAMAYGPEREISGRTVTFPYHWVMQIVPGFSSMRAPIRFLLMAQLGFAAIASIGLSWLLRFVRGRLGSAAAFAIAAVIVAVTVLDFDLLSKTRYTRQVAVGEAVPEVYRVLAAAPPGPVLEIPSNRYYGHFRGVIITSEYMLYSTFHWKPLLDGYSGYAPPSAFVTRALISALPDRKALRLLGRTTGLRYVVVHRDRLPETALGAWIAPLGLKRIGEYGDDVLFEVEREVEADLLNDLIRTEPSAMTLLGTPLAPLPANERNASLQTSYEKRMAISGYPIGLDLTIVNLSQAAWPALAPLGDHRVTLGYRWETLEGELLDEDPAAIGLAYDLAPGESVGQHLAPVAPRQGEARLIVGLVQDGEWFPTTAIPIPVSVRSGRGLAGLANEGAAELLESLRQAMPNEADSGRSGELPAPKPEQ